MLPLKDNRDPEAMGLALQTMRRDYPDEPICQLANKLEGIIVRNHNESHAAYTARVERMTHG